MTTLTVKNSKMYISIRTGMRYYFLLNLIIIFCIGELIPQTPNEFIRLLQEKITALQALEIYFTWIVISRLDDDISVNIIELLISTFVVLNVLILLFRRPEYALAFHSIYITLRWMTFSRVNLAALSISAFAFQYAGAFGPLFIFHTYFAYVDAATIRSLLSIIGFPIDGDGTLLHYPPTGALLNINVGCTSTLAIIYGLSGAVIYTIYRDAKINAALILSFIALVLTIIMMNWMRIALMIESIESYKFWHEGTGMQFVSLLNAVAILAWIHLGLAQTRDLKL